MYQKYKHIIFIKFLKLLETSLIFQNFVKNFHHKRRKNSGIFLFENKE